MERPPRPGYCRRVLTEPDLVAAGAALEERFGAERASAFARGLPVLLRGLSQRWSLEVEGLLPSGATSVVLAVTHRSGPGVLKISPDAGFLTRQVRMLRHLVPTGRVPTVLAEDPSGGAMLMERVVPGTTLDDSRATPPTPQEWAELLSDLHGTTADGVAEVLRQRCEDMFRRIGARQTLPQVNEHISREVWGRAVDECLSLLETDREQVVIHGDLHLGNVLRAESRPDGRTLVAVDPKLCVGDRCFDMVDFVVTTGTAEEMAQRAYDLASLVRVDPERLLRWSRVNAVVTGISRLSWSGPDDWTRTLLEFAQQP